MKKHYVRDLLTKIKNYKIIGNKDEYITELLPVNKARKKSLVFVDKNRQDKLELIFNTKASVVICDDSINKKELPKEKCFIMVKNPKLVFIKIGNDIFPKKVEWGRDPSSIIHPEANIHPKTYIGPFCYIGKCEIGEGSIIHGHVHIYDAKVKIGKNVVIYAGCIIGGDGFGFIMDDNGELINFPHIGGVVIEDNVELQALTHVDRGALGNTIIKEGTKTDNGCHIAHNNEIAPHNQLAAHAVFSGSVKTGENCFLGLKSSLKEQITIGKNVTVGIGANVTKSFGDNLVVAGNPARPIQEVKKLSREIKKMIAEEK